MLEITYPASEAELGIDFAQIYNESALFGWKVVLFFCTDPGCGVSFAFNLQNV